MIALRCGGGTPRIECSEGATGGVGSSEALTFRLAFIKTAIRFCCCGTGSAGRLESEGMVESEESIGAAGTAGSEGG